MAERTDCARCHASTGGEPRYDGYDIYCGRLCAKCWQTDGRREFGRTRFFNPMDAGEALEPDDY